MKHYKKLKLNTYLSIFKEDFIKKDVSKAVTLITKVLSTRLGEKIDVSPYSYIYKKSDGTYEGYLGIFGNKMIRFNFKVGNTSGNMVNIDVWNSVKEYPDITIDVSNVNVVQALDIITEAIKKGVPSVYMFSEKTVPKTGGKVSKDISASINSWAEKMSINDIKLQNSRFSHLYNDYKFWFNEYGEAEGYRLASQASFTKYLQEYMQKYNLENIFTRKITVTKGGSYQTVVNKKDKQTFDSSLYKMDLDDLMELIQMGVVTVIKGYKNSVLITGTAGIGKSKSVIEELKASGYSEAPRSRKMIKTKTFTDFEPISGKAYKLISGDIKNPRALYMLLHDWNDPNLILVFDDANAVIKNKSNVELMRTATSKGDRKITYTDSKINTDNERYKTTIDFKSKIIIITNIPKNKIDSAIVSRTSPIEVTPSQEDIFDSIRRNLNEIEPTGELEAKNDVLNFLEDTLGNKIKQIDFRVFMESIIFRLTGSPHWKKHVYAIVT